MKFEGSGTSGTHLRAAFVYGHMPGKAPRSVRSSKLSPGQPRQYCGGGPHGNTRCCRLLSFFYFLILFKDDSMYLLDSFIAWIDCISFPFSIHLPWFLVSSCHALFLFFFISIHSTFSTFPFRIGWTKNQCVAS